MKKNTAVAIITRVCMACVAIVTVIWLALISSGNN